MPNKISSTATVGRVNAPTGGVNPTGKVASHTKAANAEASTPGPLVSASIPGGTLGASGAMQNHATDEPAPEKPLAHPGASESNKTVLV